MRDGNRDYIPKRERNLTERMAEGESTEDGLAGRATVQRRTPMHRTVIDNRKGKSDSEDNGAMYHDY